MENSEKRGSMISLLNLPEHILDCILKRLSSIELIKMSEVCTCLRNACRSDRLWENHIKQKWGRIIGDAAFKEWKWHIAKFKSEETLLYQNMINQNGSLGSLCGSWPVICIGSYLEGCSHVQSFLSNNSMMGLYLSLENGKFWFPAQVYWEGARSLEERLVSDALFSYDSKSDTFKARAPSGAWQIMGHRIRWEKLRISPVEDPPCVRYICDCLEDLKPGDHIEIQYKERSETHYDWLHGIIGRLRSCNENGFYGSCGDSGTLVVVLREYLGGQLAGVKQVFLPRDNIGREGDMHTGFYGGIRKLNSEEIQKWMEQFP